MARIIRCWLLSSSSSSPWSSGSRSGSAPARSLPSSGVPPAAAYPPSATGSVTYAVRGRGGTTHLWVWAAIRPRSIPVQTGHRRMRFGHRVSKLRSGEHPEITRVGGLSCRGTPFVLISPCLPPTPARRRPAPVRVDVTSYQQEQARCVIDTITRADKSRTTADTRRRERPQNHSGPSNHIAQPGHAACAHYFGTPPFPRKRPTQSKMSAETSGHAALGARPRVPGGMAVCWVVLLACPGRIRRAG